MARHDREESLEEQLAWLDAIKDTEDNSVTVSAKTGPVEVSAASPYPEDPWGLANAQHETPTPPLFRAAVDSVYGPGAAGELPEEESEAAEWLSTRDTTGDGSARSDVRRDDAAPAAAAPTETDDPFHAPLRPLPRHDEPLRTTGEPTTGPVQDQDRDQNQGQDEDQDRGWARGQVRDRGQNRDHGQDQGQGRGPGQDQRQGHQGQGRGPGQDQGQEAARSGGLQADDTDPHGMTLQSLGARLTPSGGEQPGEQDTADLPWPLPPDSPLWTDHPTATPSIHSTSTPTTPASTPATAAPSASRPATSTAPTSTAPASTAPASTAPASTAPASTVPASTVPASTVPASTPSASRAAGSTGPASAAPASTAPASTSSSMKDARPGGGRAGDVRSGDGPLAGARFGEASPADGRAGEGPSSGEGSGTAWLTSPAERAAGRPASEATAGSDDDGLPTASSRSGEDARLAPQAEAERGDADPGDGPTPGLLPKRAASGGSGLTGSESAGKAAVSEGSATVGRLPGSPGDGARSAFQPQADDRRTPLDTPAPKGGAAFETAGSEGGAAFETAGPEGREAPGAAGGRSAPGAAGGADGRTAPDAAEDPAAFDAVEGRAAFDAAAREAQEAFEAAARERRGKFGTEAGEGRAASDVLGPEGTGTFEDSGAEGPGAFGDFGSEGPGAFGDSGSEGRGAFAGSASEGAGTFWGSASEGTGTFGAGGSGDGGVPEWRPADRRVLPQPDTQPQQPSLPDVGRLGPHGHQPDLQDGGRAHGHQPGLQDGGPGHGQQSESGLLDGGRVHGRHAVQGGEVSPQGRASTGRASFEEREERGEQGQASGVGRRRAAPVPVFAAPPRAPVAGRPNADSLDPESLLRGRRNAPSKGWRRLVYKASGGWIKPGEPPEVRRRRELLTRARTPVTTGHHRVAVLSLKGGVGKTTTTVGLGATLAQVRGDRVIAVDANPDRGTLSDKLVLETSATVRDLLTERNQVKRYVDIRAFTSQAPSRLEVLASDRDPSVSEAFSGADYQAVSQVLENFYSICITDCGTGLLHSAMGGVLGLADQIVLVSSPSVDGARAASATLDWLEAHHYGDLVRNATVVLCSVRPRSKSAVDISKLEAHFAARCRAVIRVPYDPHLEEGAEIDLDRLQEATRDAYLQLAACVGDGFAGTRE